MTVMISIAVVTPRFIGRNSRNRSWNPVAPSTFTASRVEGAKLSADRPVAAMSATVIGASVPRLTASGLREA